MQAKQQRETIMRERDIQNEWTMRRPMTNSRMEWGPIGTSTEYEQLERSTCPCQDTSATKALKAQHETFSSTEVFNDKAAIHGECSGDRNEEECRAWAVIQELLCRHQRKLHGHQQASTWSFQNSSTR